MRRDGLNDQEPLIPVFNPRPYGDIYTVRLADGHVVQLTHNKWDDGTPPPGVREVTSLPPRLGIFYCLRVLPGRAPLQAGGFFRPAATSSQPLVGR